MDFFSTEQVWGIFMFLLGAGVLSWCSHWERIQAEWRKNPKNKYKKSRRKIDFVVPTTIRGTMMTISGVLLSLAGITVFFLHAL
jgi:hypothetical protein